VEEPFAAESVRFLSSTGSHDMAEWPVALGLHPIRVVHCADFGFIHSFVYFAVLRLSVR